MSTSRAKQISSNESHDWDTIKDVFATLYVTEDRPLREVRAILAEKYGFFATERMYKRRINHWQLDKNNKEEEMQFLAQRSAERAAIGKRSAFRVRNREITQAALDHYFKRKKISEVRGRTRSSDEAATPPHIVCYTPPDTPTPETSESSSPDVAPSDTPSTGNEELVVIDKSPKPTTPLHLAKYRPPEEKYWLLGAPNQLETPGQFKSMEILLSATQEFFQSTLIAKDGVDIVLVTQQASSWNMRKFYVLANSVASYMSEGSWQEAQTAYGQTLEHVGPVLRDRNPILFVCLVQICCKFMKDGQLPALRPLLQLVRGMSAHAHSASHSMHILCGALLESMDMLSDVLTMGLSQAVDILKNRLGQDHPQTRAVGRGLHSILMTSGDYAGALRAFQPVADIEEKIGDAMTFESRYRVIGSLIAMGHLDEAAVLIESAQKLVDALEDPEQKAQLTLGILSTRGEWLRLSRDPRAIDMLTEAYEFAKAHTWLHNGSWTLNARRALRLAKTSLFSDAPLVPFIYWF